MNVSVRTATVRWFVLVSMASLPLWGVASDTLPPLKDATTPQNHEELWAAFDPRRSRSTSNS